VQPMRPAAGRSGRSVVLGTLWRARWVILVAAVLAGGAGYALSALQDPAYTAQSRLVLSAAQEFDPLGRQSFSDSARFVANQVSVLSSQPVVDAALQELADGTTRDELVSSLDVSASATADVLEVAATGPTAEAAAARANSVVEAYRASVRARVTERAAAAVAATTDPAVADQINTQAAAYGDGLAVVDAADVPTEPAAPLPLRDGLVLALVAALVAAGLALLRRSPAAAAGPVSEIDGVPVLGTVPTQRLGREGVPGPEADDFAVPLMSLGYVMGAGNGPVLVAGLTHNSGAAAVVHGLATAAAAGGQRVLVVDADPRDRELVRRIGTGTPMRPLAELRKGVGTDEVVVGAPVGPDGRRGIDLAVLGAADGPSRHDGADVQAALGRLQGAYDLVFIRVGPVAQSPSAIASLRLATVALAAVGAGEGADGLGELRQFLRLADLPLAGVVLTAPTRWRRKTAPTREPAPVPKRTTGPLPPKAANALTER
jgi:capsular polysaccharide biosynthesis protein